VLRPWLGLTLALSLLGCSTGEGKGSVKSDRLFVRDCWNGSFDLQPDFFASNPFSDETQVIRVQRGDNLQDVSDGLMVLVNDTQAIRNGMLGAPIPVGLAAGVAPPGVPLTLDPDPPLVNLALYLHDSCHTQNATLHSIGGTITFDALFSGVINEADGSDRLTDATFSACFADPRDLTPGESQDESSCETDETGVFSMVTGYFSFYFQRGQPAQPFP
jgi:hypothetical protein